MFNKILSKNGFYGNGNGIHINPMDMHKAFLADQSVLRLRTPSKRQPFEQSIFFSYQQGICLNPTISGLNALYEAGMNPLAVSHVIVTDTNRDIVEAVLKMVLRQERLKIVIPEKLKPDFIRLLNRMVGHAYPVSDWLTLIGLKGAGKQVPLHDSKLSTDMIRDDKELVLCLGGQNIALKALNGPLHEAQVISTTDWQKERLAEDGYVRKSNLFSHIDDQDFLGIIKESDIIEVGGGETLIHQGAQADYCYVLLSGQADVFVDSQYTWRFYSQDFFGDVGLQSEVPRTATVKAKTPVVLLRIPRETYLKHINNPIRGVAQKGSSLKSFNQIKWALQRVFQSISPQLQLSETALESIALMAQTESYHDQVVEGARGEAAYLVLDGKLEVVRGEPLRRLGYMKAGDLFGEMALLDPTGTRTATIRNTGKPATVLRISYALFQRILFQYPGFDRGIRDVIIARRRETRQAVYEPRMSKIPGSLTDVSAESDQGTNSIRELRIFLRIFSMKLTAQGFSLQELKTNSAKLYKVQKQCGEILGEHVLRQGFIKQFRLTKKVDAAAVSYDFESRQIIISNQFFLLSAAERNQQISVILGSVLHRYLCREALIGNEEQSLDESLSFIQDLSMDQMNGHVPEKVRQLLEQMQNHPGQSFAYFVSAYLLMGDQLRSAIHSLQVDRGLRQHLASLYGLLNESFFAGQEFTAKSSASPLENYETAFLMKPSSLADLEEDTRVIGQILNEEFGQIAAQDRKLLYYQFYEPEVYHRLKMDCLRQLKHRFEQVHIQKLTDQEAEITIYSSRQQLGYRLQFRRTRKGKYLAWECVESKKLTGDPPVRVDLVNLASAQFRGVKGTPENVLTLEGMLRAHLADEASVQVLDGQMPENNIHSIMEEWRLNPPDVVGISATFGTLHDLIDLLTQVHLLERPPVVVLGNLLSTHAPEYLLELFPQVICVHHEGEEAILQVVQRMKDIPVDNIREFLNENSGILRAIPNLTFLEDKTLIRTSHQKVSPDRIPDVDRKTLVGRQKNARFLFNAETSRGCGYSACFFCTRTHGRIRTLPLQRSLKDFRAYMEAQVPFVVYVDEDFLGKTETGWNDAFAEELVKLRASFRKEYLARTGKEPILPTFYVAARAQSIYKEGDSEGNQQRLNTLKKLKAAGLVKIFLGGESGSPVQFKKTYHKGGSIGEVEKAIEVLRKEGIEVVVGFITYDPLTNMHQLHQDIDFMKRNGLVYVNENTEPLNPFKYFRVQVDSPLGRTLQQAGLICSSLNPDLLSHDATYRNPLIRLNVAMGNYWKTMTDELDYFLKGIVWFAEQSPDEREKARAFIELFNKLKQADLRVIEAYADACRDIDRAAGSGIERFLHHLKTMPIEKARFEVARVLLPHTDVVRVLNSWLDGQSQVDSSTLSQILRSMLAGEIPVGFTLRPDQTNQWPAWMQECREDLGQQMMSPEVLAELQAQTEVILKNHLGQRLQCLEAFQTSDWKAYYHAHPEAMQRGNEFAACLEKATNDHRQILQTGGQLLDRPLDHPDFKVYWRASMAEFLAYRHPHQENALGPIIEWFNQLHSNEIEKVPSLEQVFINEYGQISFDSSQSNQPVMKVVAQVIEKLYINGFDEWYAKPEITSAFRVIYNRVHDDEEYMLADAISDLQALYRRLAQPFSLEIEGRSISMIPNSPDGLCLFRIRQGKDDRFAPTIGGKFLPASVDVSLPEGILEMGPRGARVKNTQAFETWIQEMTGRILDANEFSREQERLNLLNGLVELAVQLDCASDQLMETIADRFDQMVLPKRLYLPDQKKYHSWLKKHPGSCLFVHPRLFATNWPGLEAHLGKLSLLLKPEAFDSWENTLKMLRSGKLNPEWLTFIYEVYFNRLSPNAFLRNPDSGEIIARCTALSGRIMPLRAPVVWINQQDETPDHMADQDRIGLAREVKQFMQQNPGMKPLMIHPLVADRWKVEGNNPFTGNLQSTALVLPTSSARTLYVLSPTGDFVAKTASEMWIGPSKRGLTVDNVTHSRLVSRQIKASIDGAQLPPQIRDQFAFIDDRAGCSVVAPGAVNGKETVGAIYRSVRGYPYQPAEQKSVVMPAFTAHNNAVSVEDNHTPPMLVQVLDRISRDEGRQPLDVFEDEILRPLYRMFFYYMFKQGILLEPHGQNFFFEMDDMGKFLRLIYKDWQSTMMDLETRIRRGLPQEEFFKHLLGKEASKSLSFSLVFDYYFGTYLLENIFNTLVNNYQGDESQTAFSQRLRLRFKDIFEQEISIFPKQVADAPDYLVHHGKKPENDRTNDMYFAIDGPPGFRHTTYERTLMDLIEQRKAHGKVRVPLVEVHDDVAKITSQPEEQAREIDLDRVRLMVRSGDEWKDIREGAVPAEMADMFYVCLPKDYDPQKPVDVHVYLHGLQSQVSEIFSWTDKFDDDQRLVVVPLAPHRDQQGRYYWYRDGHIDEDKAKSMKTLNELLLNVSSWGKVGKIRVGGISLGGFMATQWLLQNDRIDEGIIINAPFKKRFLDPDLDIHPNLKGKRVLSVHLQGDEVVSTDHGERLRDFLTEKGVEVESVDPQRGVHHLLSPMITERVKGFVEGESSPHLDSLTLVQTLTKKSLDPLQRRSTEQKSSAVTLDSEDPALVAWYEIVLDAAQPLSTRLAGFKVLERSGYQPLQDNWEVYGPMVRFEGAQSKLKTVERTVIFLTSMLAARGLDGIEADLIEDFKQVTSSLRMLQYDYREWMEGQKDQSRPDEFRAYLNKVDYCYQTILECKRNLLQ